MRVTASSCPRSAPAAQPVIRTLRKEADIFESGSSFEKVLRSYQIGGITYSDFLGYVNWYLAAGQSAAGLLEVLNQRQLIEPLPDFAHDAVARLLNEHSPASSKEPEAATEPSATAEPPPASRSPPTAATRPAETVSADVPSAAVASLPTKTVAIPRAGTNFSNTAPLNDIAPLTPEPPPRPDMPPEPEKPFAMPPHAETNLSERTSPLQPVRPVPMPSRPSAEPTVTPGRPFLSHTAAPPLTSRPFEPEKTVVIPRAVENLEDYGRRPRATPSLKPIPPHPTVVLPKPAHPPMPPEKTVVIPRGGMLISDYEPTATGASTEPRSDSDLFNASASKPPDTPWKIRTAWLTAALVAIVIGWVYTRPSTAPPARQAAGVFSGTAAPAPPQAAAAEPGTTLQDCPTCPRMTVLPAGRFKQGSAYDDHDALPAEKPRHIVLIRQSLAMATTELTVENFREFVADTNRELQGCETYDGEWHHKANASWKDPGFAQSADHPVTCVSWNDAVAYAAWLSAKTGHHYRLPSASEWEYAARSGSDAQLPWSPGLQAACENANVADRVAARRYPKWSVFACKDGYLNTAPVGSFKANAFGLSDMLGNVFEWTQDCWHDDYFKAPIDGSARMDGDCSEHELRGGSWFSSPAFVRLAYRNHYATAYRSSSIGIRLVREIDS